MRGYSVTCAPIAHLACHPVRISLQAGWRGHIFALLVAAPLGVIALSSTTAALELPKPEPVEKFLGTTAVGENYNVKPVVRSDGVMRIFDVDTKYGEYSFDGIEFAKASPSPDVSETGNYVYTEQA